MGRRRKVVELVTAQVPVPISEVEVSVKANELAQVCGDIDKIKADAADHASTERKKVRALEKRRRVLAECVRTGTEMRDAQLGFEDTERKGKGKQANGGVDA